jgi:large subunit ribosomal protein L6
MSRLGKLPIELKEGVQVKLDGGFVIVKGPNGELREKLHPKVKIEVNAQEVKVSVNNPEEKKEKALWGLFASLIRNMVKGVKDGFEKKLEINGVGFRAAVSGRKLVLNVGFSHPVEYNLPEGINARVEGNIIVISGASKQLVGEVAAQVRRIKRPEPYKGKGIKYVEEVIIRKEGKTAAKTE